MGDLPAGSSWGSFRIERLLGESPLGSVYRVSQDGRAKALRVFNAGLDESLLNRFEDDTRRVVGLSHPNILRVEAVGREGGRRFIVTEFFESLSLRDVGPRPLREGCELLLKSARGLQAAWMRLVLHRNLKPENILVSMRGEVKLADFGLFQEPTRYWSPERVKGQTPDMRGDLFSLGTIFAEFLRERDAEIDALLSHMTRVEPFDRVQMVEDVVSRLESYLARSPTPSAAVAPPAPIAMPEIPAPPPISMPPPPPFPSWMAPAPEPGLQQARATLVRTLDAVTHRLERSMAHRHILRVPPPAPEPPAPSFPSESEIRKLFDEAVAPPPPPPPPPVILRDVSRPREPARTAAPPPTTRIRPKKKGSPVFRLLILVGLGAFIYLKVQRTIDRQRSVLDERPRSTTSVPVDRPKPEPPAPYVRPSRKADQDWARVKEDVRSLEKEMKYAEALAECETYISSHAADATAESRTVQKSLKEWIDLVRGAERARQTRQEQRAYEILDRGNRPKDKEKIVARWCDEDWAAALKQCDPSAADYDPWTAQETLGRFLKKPHGGGAHAQEVDARRLLLQADIDYADLTDRVKTLLLSNRAPAAVDAMESFLVLSHRGGSHREEIEKKIVQIKEEIRQTLFTARTSITRLAVSPGGTRVAFVSDGIKVLDPATRASVWTQGPTSLIRQIAFSGEGVLASIQSNKITLWHLSKKSEGRVLNAVQGTFYFVGFSRDGKLAVATQFDGTLLAWDLEKDEPPIVEKNVAAASTAVALAPVGTTIAIASRDKTIRVREIASGSERKWALPGASGVALAWSPDATRLASCGSDEAVSVWDVAKGTLIYSLPGHKGGASCVAFSADGATLASGGADRAIRLWNLKDGAAAGSLEGHRERVTALGWLAGGEIVSSSSDGSVRLWPARK